MLFLGQLEGKLAWANILISTLDFFEHRKTESFCEPFIAASSLAGALSRWLSSSEVPDAHYPEMSVMLLLLSPPQAMALLVHRPR